MTIVEISFELFTFVVQVHGLPSVYLHEGSAIMVENKVRRLHGDSLGKRCVVANRYLRLKIDTDVRNPLLVGFFQDKLNEEEVWIQFKYERLSDFCYKCGIIDHVAGKNSEPRPSLPPTMAFLSNFTILG